MSLYLYTIYSLLKNIYICRTKVSKAPHLCILLKTSLKLMVLTLDNNTFLGVLLYLRMWSRKPESQKNLSININPGDILIFSNLFDPHSKCQTIQDYKYNIQLHTHHSYIYFCKALQSIKTFSNLEQKQGQQ